MRGGDGDRNNTYSIEDSVLVLGDFVTGRVIGAVSGNTGNVRGSIGTWAQLDVTTPSSFLRQYGRPRPWQHYLAWVVGGWIQEAGPVASWEWMPGYLAITGVGAEAYFRRFEVQKIDAPSASLMLETTVSRGSKTDKTKQEWKPNPAARVAVANRSVQAAAATLISTMRAWPDTPPIIAGHYSTGASGSYSNTWDGIDHEMIGDALDTVLAGREWRLDPYWKDSETIGWDLLIGDPELVRDENPVAWPAEVATVDSVTFSGEQMAGRSSATSTDSRGKPLSSTATSSFAPPLMALKAQGGESSTMAGLSAVAAAGVATTPSVEVKVSLPATRVGYLATGQWVTLEDNADGLLLQEQRILDYSTDLATLNTTATLRQQEA